MPGGNFWANKGFLGKSIMANCALLAMGAHLLVLPSLISAKEAFELESFQTASAPIVNSDSPVVFCAALDEENYVYISSKGSAKCIDVKGKKILYQAAIGTTTTDNIALFKKGTRLAHYSNGSFTIYDAKSFEYISEQRCEADGFSASPSDERICYWKSSHAYLSELGKPVIKDLNLRDKIQKCSFSQDGSKVLLVTKSRLYIWSTDTNAPADAFNFDDEISSACFINLQVFAISRNGNLYKIPEKGQTPELLKSSVVPSPHLISSCGEKTLLAIGSSLGYIRILNLLTDVVSEPIWCFPECIARTENGERLLVGSSIHCMQLIDTYEGKLIRLNEGHQGKFSSLKLSPDGRVLATSGQDGVVRIWDCASGSLLRDVPAEIDVRPDQAIDLCFSPCGERLFIGRGSSIYLWSMNEDIKCRRVVGLPYCRIDALDCIEPDSVCVIFRISDAVRRRFIREYLITSPDFVRGFRVTNDKLSPGHVSILCNLPKLNTVFWGGVSDGVNLSAWDLNSKSKVLIKGTLDAICFSQGSLLYATFSNGAVEIYEAYSEGRLNRILLPLKATCGAFLGQRHLVVGFPDGKISIYDILSGLKEFSYDVSASGIALLTTDSRYQIILATEAGSLYRIVLRQGHVDPDIIIDWSSCYNKLGSEDASVAIRALRDLVCSGLNGSQELRKLHAASQGDGNKQSGRASCEIALMRIDSPNFEVRTEAVGYLSSHCMAYSAIIYESLTSTKDPERKRLLSEILGAAKFIPVKDAAERRALRTVLALSCVRGEHGKKALMEIANGSLSWVVRYWARYFSEVGEVSGEAAQAIVNPPSEPEAREK